MSFQDNLNRICKERGTTLTALVKSMGLSTSKVSRWNEGSLPKQDMLVRLANELNCSVADFFKDESVDIPRIDADEADMLRVYRGLSRRDKHEFMATVYDFEKRIEDKSNATA